METVVWSKPWFGEVRVGIGGGEDVIGDGGGDGKWWDDDVVGFGEGGLLGSAVL